MGRRREEKRGRNCVREQDQTEERKWKRELPLLLWHIDIHTQHYTINYSRHYPVDTHQH